MGESFRKAPAMLHSINREGRLLEVSQLWLEKLGYEESEVLGRPSVEFLTEESARYAREVVLPDFFVTGRCEVEYQMVRKDGTIFPVRLRAVAERDEAGAIVRSIAVVEDLSEQRLLEKRMLDAQKLDSLGLMAGGIAHDFNNLLVSILGNAQIAFDEVRDQPDALASITDIVTAARRAADLCRQLLAYSGKSRMQEEQLDLSELVKEIAQVLEVSVGRDALIKLDLNTHIKTVGDATQLRQVLMNLVINAGESLEGKRGLISIATSARELDVETIARSSNLAARPGPYVCVEVADTGCGIPEDVRDRIFDPFFTTKVGGHGLGLAAVHGIIRAHGGTITFYTSPGRGTSFKVFLPVVAASVSADPTSDVPKRGTVLIVDDDPTVLKTLSRLLPRGGYQVVTTSSGEEALLLVKARGDEFDLFLFDVSMPKMSGPELFDEVRAILPDARVLLMSGFNHVDMVRRAESRGLAGFLQKPFLLESFDELAHRAMDR